MSTNNLFLWAAEHIVGILTVILVTYAIVIITFSGVL
jgi:hypothetical protein